MGPQYWHFNTPDKLSDVPHMSVIPASIPSIVLTLIDTGRLPVRGKHARIPATCHGGSGWAAHRHATVEIRGLKSQAFRPPWNRPNARASISDMMRMPAPRTSTCWVLRRSKLPT